MEKKIIFCLFVFLLTSCSNSVDNSIVSKASNAYDTIFFSSENATTRYRKVFNMYESFIDENYVIYKSKGKGNIIWIDTVLHFETNSYQFYSICSIPTQGYYLVFFNGDSLESQKVAINQPQITEYHCDNFTVLCIVDTTYYSGYTNVCSIFYQIADFSIVAKETYFNKRFEDENFDFLLSIKKDNSTVSILKNTKLDFVFSEAPPAAPRMH